MRSIRAGRVVLSATVWLGLVAIAAPAQARQSSPESKECNVEVAAEAIPVHPDLFEVRATFSAALGERIVALLDKESRVRVAAVEPDPDHPRSVRLTLDTSEAVVGDWTLVLESDTGVCRGAFRVARIPTIARR